MTHIGVDLEQFVVDPHSSGIQRVLQQLALHWPSELAGADFVVPWRNSFVLLPPTDAAALISLAFEPRGQEDDLRNAVQAWCDDAAGRYPSVTQGDLISLYNVWLLPEVSYLPSVLARAELMKETMPLAMIGYDALPMTDPANYRFVPGTSANVSRYFRLLVDADAVICISDYARRMIIERLRRGWEKVTTVSHPGGDHVPVNSASKEERGLVRFLRVGTMEDRKLPRELVAAFRGLVATGQRAELVFLGRPSFSDAVINETVAAAEQDGIGVVWHRTPSDDEVAEALHDSDVFLSVGVEGYGIPVLEALRAGTPVIAGGVQPAAELLQGKAVHFLGEPTVEALIEMFVTYSTPESVRALRDGLDPHSVPTWRDFAKGVVQGALAG